MVVYKEPAQEAPCKEACPAGIDVSLYLRLAAQGKYDDALAVIRDRIPFPSVCGRICPSPCETECNAGKVDEPIRIRAIKRFIVEQASAAGYRESPSAPKTDKRLAIVGSGPAGLTAAYYLAKLGHAITVYEAHSEPGGMMSQCIPNYRLPKAVLDAEIKRIQGAGVDIKTNSRVDSVGELLKEGYNAVFIAVGAHVGLKLGIPGEDDPKVMEGVVFLKKVNRGEKVNLGERVAVIGGGNVALDAARTALRLGAKSTTIIYRRTRDEMPATREEVDGALEEGINIVYLAAPKRIWSKGGAVELQCVRMRLGKPDASGRRRPVAIKGSEFSADYDIIIVAIGQIPEVLHNFQVPTGRGNVIRVRASGATSREGVFAGGDATTGPASVIAAIAAGRQAASSIDKYLGGNGNIDFKLAPREWKPTTIAPGLPIGPRLALPSLLLQERLASFSEVELSLTPEQASNEAMRCLGCDLSIVADPQKCNGCLICQLRCSLRFEGAFVPSKAAINIGGLASGAYEYIFTERCDNCSICVRYCSYGALTHQRKEAYNGFERICR